MVLQTNLPFSLWNLWMTYYLTTWTWVTDEIEITEHLALRCGDFHWLSRQATCKAIISIIRWAVEGHKSQGSGRQRASKTGLHIRVGLQRKNRLALETYGGVQHRPPSALIYTSGTFQLPFKDTHQMGCKLISGKVLQLYSYKQRAWLALMADQKGSSCLLLLVI